MENPRAVQYREEGTNSMQNDSIQIMQNKSNQTQCQIQSPELSFSQAQYMKTQDTHTEIMPMQSNIPINQTKSVDIHIPYSSQLLGNSIDMSQVQTNQTAIHMHVNDKLCNLTHDQSLIHSPLSTNFQSTTSKNHKTMETFHKQQFKWRQTECTTCHEIWPSRHDISKKPYECLRCSRDKCNPKKFSNTNNMHPGSVPECLQNLTQVEEMLIARVSPIMYVYKKHGGQRGYKGHVLNLSQDIQSLLDKLPQSVSNLPIIILRRTGANDSFTDFTVRREIVLTALQWLKLNNPFYKSIVIDYAMIDQLPENGVPSELLHSNWSNNHEDMTQPVPLSNNLEYSTDDESDTEMDSTESPIHETDDHPNDIAEHNYSSFIPVPHQGQTEIEAIQSVIHENTPVPWPELSKAPVNEFNTEGLATMAFPTLFPYGTGDPTAKDRQHPVSLSECFKHLISFGEVRNNKFLWRFATHPRFMYWALNMKQRHHLLSQSSVYLKQHPSDAALTLQQLRNMVDKSTSEQLMSRLHKYVSKVQGTKQYWYQRSLELKALIQTKGPPTFFFTVSAADTYWPELHINLMPHDNANPTHSMKINAVINNPHITDWYFTKRLSDLSKHWLYDQMDAEWHWYRFEYQSRGSTHAHGCAKLKSDPGLCELMKKAALAWKLRDKSHTELSQAEKYIIEEGIKAQQTIIKYVEWLTTTFNQSLPSETWRMPPPQYHPSAQNPLDVSDIEQDYNDLVNTVERHTKCNAAYCLRKKTGQNQLQCRFNYPRPIQLQTTIEFEELTNKRIRAKVATKRNDPLINSHNKSLLQYWRANVDVQTIVDIEDCVRYMTKYAAKAETKSQTAKQIFKTCVSKLSPTSQTCNVVRSAMIKSIGERDFSAQETAHMLLGLPLYSCTYTFATVSLDDSKVVEIQHTSETRMSTKLSIVQFYADRSHNALHDQTVLHMNLLQYSSHFYVHNNTVKERKTEVIIHTYPSYSSNPKGKHYPQYCKYQLIKYKPWQGHLSNAWDNLPDTDDTYITVYHKFMKNQNAAQYLPHLEEELELVEQYLQENITDEYETDQAEAQNEQEDWMILSQLNPTFDNPETDGTNNINWHSLVTSISPELIHESANWVNTRRKENTQTFQQNIQIDTNTLNNEQKLAFDIITNHYKKTHTGYVQAEQVNDNKQLLMIIYGTAGTGKSYLIHAIASQLKEDCCLTATTGIAAFNINGVTIHSLLQLPIRNQNAKELEGAALMRLQERMKYKKYIIIDEMSMLGQRSFTWIDNRLRQATAQYDKPFGGISIILIGDFAQLPPIGDRLLFNNPNVTSHESNDHGYLLYTQFKTVVKLKQILRQDSATNDFKDLLLAIRNGNITHDIWQSLLSRSPTNVSNLSDFNNATHLFFDKLSVAECNLRYLQTLNTPVAKIEAVNSDHTAQVTTSDEAGGLDSVVYIAKHSKVMLTSNLWQQTGLCNGATGIVQDIIYANNQNPPLLPISVLVEFAKYKGPAFIPDHPTWVPIPPVTFEWTTIHRHSRRQLPLRLSYAMTIHKSQGQTLHKAVIDIGDKERTAGLTFVALSRLQKFSDIIIQSMSFQRLKSISRSKHITARLNEEERLQDLHDKTKLKHNNQTTY